MKEAAGRREGPSVRASPGRGARHLGMPAGPGRTARELPTSHSHSSVRANTGRVWSDPEAQTSLPCGEKCQGLAPLLNYAGRAEGKGGVSRGLQEGVTQISIEN